MAACKSSSVDGGVQVAASSLPITCKLQSPPTGVMIAGVEYYPSGTGKGISCKVSADGRSFTFPAGAESGGGAIAAGATVVLEVRIEEPFDGSAPAWVVEDCDDESLILGVTSAIGKMAQVQVQIG